MLTPNWSNGVSGVSNRHDAPNVSCTRQRASRTLTTNQSVMGLLPTIAREARYSARRSIEVLRRGRPLKYLAGAAALASAFVLAGVAAANTTGDVLTLYPVGGGQDTYAAWKAQEGRPDSQGTANQALYLQHLSNAPAAAHITGLEG